MQEKQLYNLALGKVVAQLRERRGLTQAQLAAQAGMTQSGLSRLESGLGSPDVFQGQKLAEALGVSATELDAKVKEALRVAQRAAGAVRPAEGTPTTDWWSLLGFVALAGLIVFAVASILENGGPGGGKPGSGPPKPG